MVDLNTNALTTLATVKDELGIPTLTTTYDETIKRMINSVSALVESFCNRSFYYEVDKSEDIAGYGGRFLFIDKTPLLSIDSISYDSTEIDSANYTIEGDGSEGFIRSESGFWTWTGDTHLGITPQALPYSEQALFTVVYTGGYVTPQQVIDDETLTRTLPWDLEDAVIQSVVDRYRAKGRDNTIKSEKVLQESITYQDNAKGNSGLSLTTEAMLKPYCRVVGL